jgi:hypothetical protein
MHVHSFIIIISVIIILINQQYFYIIESINSFVCLCDWVIVVVLAGLDGWGNLVGLLKRLVLRCSGISS